MTEDEVVGWHHQFNVHEFEQAPGDGEGEVSQVSCSPWKHESQLIGKDPDAEKDRRHEK